ncbi:MAG: molybdopterin-dependent oxidoreductase [Hyphomicrobiales bacterium]
MRFTAAHWGTYQAKGEGDMLELLPLDSDPHPSPIANGWIDAARSSDARIKKPAIRKGWLDKRDTKNRCSDAFVEVEWDVALDLAAAELQRVSRDHGNEAIFAGSYGWASAGRFHHAQSQMRRFLNTIGGFTYSKDTYSHAAAEVFFPHILGMTNRAVQDGMTSLSLVAEHCELLIAFGGISSRTAQITSSGTSKHEVEGWLEQARANGMQVANISPLKSDYSEKLDADWHAIKPNTDTALMLGLAHAIHANNQHDVAFLTSYCHGWEEFELYLTGKLDGVPKTPDWASAICGIPAAAIVQLASKMASKRTMISVAWGIQRADHGEQPLWMGLVLAAMLGQIGKPGTGFSFGYGSTTPVGRSGKLYPWPSVPQGHNPISKFIPVARITDALLHPGGEYKYDGASLSYPDIKLIYWSGGNPFHHQQDLHRLDNAWSRPETVIVNEPWWTATARRADIVFPVTTPLERHDIMMNRRDPALVWMDQLFEPVGDARDDYDVFSGLAERLGTFDVFTGGMSKHDWLQHLWSGAQAVATDHKFALPDLAEFRNTGFFECPNSFQERIFLDQFISDPDKFPLKTASRKIEIVSKHIGGLNLADCPKHPSWMEPIEWLGAQATKDDQLHLISGQPIAKLHSQLDSGSWAEKYKRHGREPVSMHPDTASVRGISDGDTVCLSNPRGRCLATAVLTSGIQKNTVALATGAWFDPQLVDGELLEVHGNPNVLTIDKGSSELSQANIAHTALVRMDRWDGSVPAIKVHCPPRFEKKGEVSE